MVRQLFSRVGLVVLAIAVLLSTVGINHLLKRARIDLTEDRLYTLTQGSKNLLSDLNRPATLQLFYSESRASDVPVIRTYARRVRELLEEYVLESNGKLTLEVIDPEPFSENEDTAAEYGIQAVPIGAGGSKEIYFGLVIASNEDNKNVTKKDKSTQENVRREVIGFLHPDKERFLEYDISKLVYAVTQDKQSKIGLLSTLQINGGFDIASRQSSDPWSSISQLEKNYEVSTIETTVTEIPEDLKLLMIVHPKDLTEPTLYAIDQFVLKGGHVLVFVDPVAESETQSSMGGVGDRSSTLGPLFESWGIEYNPKKVVLDSRNALQVGSSSGRPVRHLGILGLSEESFNRDDVITSNLKKVNLTTSGAIRKKEDSSMDWDVLLKSSSNAMLTDADVFSFMLDPSVLFKNFQVTGENYIIAARISGPVNTAFPDGYPNVKKNSESDSAKTNSKSGKNTKNHVTKSDGDIHVIVVADTDILTDRLWVQKTTFFSQRILQPFANNGDLLINMIDNLLGNQDLINVRGRGQFSRPFEKVNELEREAESRFYQKEEALKQRLAETESKIRDLQTKKEGEESLVLNSEQETAVEKFVHEKIKIRKELREVQHQLSKDIETLGSNLKIFNILFMPMLLTFFALGFRFYRKKRKVKNTSLLAKEHLT